MDPTSPISELLYEQNIISDEEKAEILKKIDKDFSDNFETTARVHSLTAARPRGLLLPLLISIGSVVLTLLVVFIFSRSTISNTNRCLITCFTQPNLIMKSFWPSPAS